jgi:hypothetical protein
MLAGSEIRRRWRGTVAIMLLVGVVGAIVLATAAGARRSDTALERFNAFSRSSDVEIAVGHPSDEELESFRRTPGIAIMTRLRAYALQPEGTPEELAIGGPLDDQMGRTLDRSRLIAGRRADPSDPLEITIGETLAEQLGLGVRGHIDSVSFTQPQLDAAFSGGGPMLPDGPSVRFRVVGIVRRPLDLSVRSGSGGVVVLTPAFEREYGDRMGVFTEVLRVRTEGRPGDLTRVIAAARRQFGDEQTFGAQGLGIETEGARNAIDVITLALWIIAGVAALAGLAAVGIVLTRDISTSSLDQGTLNALGLTRRRRAAVAMPRTMVVAVGGALLAAAGAVALSPAYPIGVARRADPNPGLHADWTVLLLAIPLIIVVVLGVALLASVRATGLTPSDHSLRPGRGTSAIVERAAGAGFRPALTNGLRMALQSGHGDTAVPVRSAFVGAIVGVAGVTAALVFAASLTHLVDTPRLYGWTWELTSEVPAAKPCTTAEDYGLAEQPGVEAVGIVCSANQGIEVDDRPAAAWGFRSLSGTVEPEVVAGRAPRGPNEVALGAVTLDAIGKGIGDTVDLRGARGPREFVVVGRIVLPNFGSTQPLADGAAVTRDGFDQLYDPGENETQLLVAHLEPGADRAAIEKELSTGRQVQIVQSATIPVEVERLQQIDRIPVYLAALLGVLALVAVGHAVVTAVRRRRSELALLKVLGFTRRQVRATVAWQATILGAVGLLVGIPIGVVIGRLIWQLVADGLGVTPAVASPALWLLVTVPAALLLVNLIAYFPARAAARTRPAVALRSA